MTTYTRFIESIAALGNIPTEDAKLVADYYVSEKIAVCDKIGGQYGVVHGAFLNADVIARAVDAAKGGTR